jgi:hypothetical protein
MNIKAFALAAILGISVPAVADITISNPAMANSGFNYPDGVFSDGTWEVTLRSGDNGYSYTGTNLQSGKSLYISSAPKTSGNRRRQVYTWRKGDYRYQIAYQPNDPNYIRLLVIAPNGGVVLNRLLSQN